MDIQRPSNRRLQSERLSCTHPNVRLGASLCENAQEQRARSIVFSKLVLYSRHKWFLVFSGAKLRRAFYTQFESRRFSHSLGGLATFFRPGVLDPARRIEKGPLSGDGGPSIWES